MLDNFNVIQNLMQNNKDCFYVISIIQRARDFENEFSERKHKEHFIRPYKVGDYYSTDWCKDEDITLSLQGLNLDEVYENFVRQIAGSSLNKSQENEDLKTSVEKGNKRQLLEKQIAQLKK